MVNTLALVTSWSGLYNPFLPKVLKNHTTYAEEHGYRFLFFDDNNLVPQKSLTQNPLVDPTWFKVQAIKSALKDHDFVFWIDPDSVFADMNQSLSDLLQNSCDLVFTGDHNDVCNTGHLLFKQTEFTHDLIEKWSKLRSIPFPSLNTSHQGVTGHVADQVALNYLLAGGVASRKAVRETSQQLFNRMNGWERNADRELKSFATTHAPVKDENLARATSLLGSLIEPHVKIVTQSRLNAYPWWGRGRLLGNERGPIVHFAGPWKNHIVGWERYVFPEF